MKYFKIVVIIIVFFVTTYFLLFSKALIEKNYSSGYEEKWRIIFFFFSLVCFTLNILFGIQGNNRWGFSGRFEYAILPIIPLGVFSWQIFWNWENTEILKSAGFFWALIVGQIFVLVPLLRTRRRDG